MGIYLNPDNTDFNELRNSAICVDKSLLIGYTNSVMNTKDKLMCVSRPRRFGKSTDANMLVAYYSKGCDSSSLFKDLKISQTSIYMEHLNQHNVIFINMQEFYDNADTIKDMKNRLSKILLIELKQVFDNIFYYDDKDLILSLKNINDQMKQKFIFIIDEWDCVLRDKDASQKDKTTFLTFMNSLFKDQTYIEFVYMTGILPIKKYSNQSALNSFDEMSMLNPTPFENFMGFTENEVKELCEEYQMDFDEMKLWYDGYHFKNGISIYSPRSISKALRIGSCGNYWSKTSSFENLRYYFNQNIDGIKESIVQLLAGDMIKIDPDIFNNDASEIHSKDDVLTFLVHLGYLGYDELEKKVYIPNKEVSDSFVSAMRKSKWENTIYFLENSDKLFEATWNQDEETVAKYIEKAHQEVSIIQYNDENALAYTIYLAYITAKDYYTVVRELPSGNGFVDIAFIPKYDKPALLVELKWNKDVQTAIDQIIDKQYPAVLEHYKDNLLLVGISYEKDSQSKDHKKHTCKIIKITD
ncbi:MAG: AAA family ATPase [Erysipelotrichaceae bacterium]|nr:AAA family ATPase [Erysipelotrichaceae bacterium]